MEDTKGNAKATDLVGQENEAFDNAFPWLSNEDPAGLTLDSASCDEPDLITRITDEPIEGEKLLSEVKENWWANIDGVNWEWMFPTVEEKPRIVVDLRVPYNDTAEPANDNQKVFGTMKFSKGEELPEVEETLWADTEGFSWDWIDPHLNSDSDNDNSQAHNTQVEDDAQTSHITFDNRVAVAQDTFQELSTVHRGDIRSPSEITPTREADSWGTSSLSEDEKLLTVLSISSSQGIPNANKCPFLSAFGKTSNNNGLQNLLAKPDLSLLSMLKDLAAKLRDLANDINALVGRLAVDTPSDAWIESVFSTTRSVAGSDSPFVTSSMSSASKEHEENVCGHDYCDGSEH